MNKHVTVPKSKAKAPQAERVRAIRDEAQAAGLLDDKTARIGVRLNPDLIEQAKQQTGIEGNSELVEFALASVALAGNYSATFEKIRGKVDPRLKLGY